MSGSITAITRWPHYGDHQVARLRRSWNGSIAPVIHTFLSFCTKASAGVSILSYNVLFEDDAERYGEIIAYIANKDADVVCLQECTPLFDGMITKQFKHYNIVRGLNIHNYYNMTLTKKVVGETGVISFSSDMGRTAPYITIDGVYIVNVHLESALHTTQMRLTQIAHIEKKLKDSPTIIIGDFNFGDDAKEYMEIGDKYDDPDRGSGFTYDVQNNERARKRAYPGENSRRLDKCFVHKVKIKTYHIDSDIKLSDHYPITLVYESTQQTSPIPLCEFSDDGLSLRIRWGSLDQVVHTNADMEMPSQVCNPPPVRQDVSYSAL